MLTRNKSEWSNTECKYVDMGRVTEHVGRSLYVARETVQVMSDVWEEGMFLYSVRDDGTLSRDFIDNTMSWLIDADEAAFELYRAKQEADKYASVVAQTEAVNGNPAVKGRVVVVKRGRNTPVGKVGKVAVIIERPYGMGYHSSMRPKLGIATSAKMIEKVMPNGKVFQNHADMIWVWAHNCDVEQPTPVDTALARRIAQDHAAAAVKGLRNTQESQYRYHAQSMQGYKVAQVA